MDLEEIDRFPYMDDQGSMWIEGANETVRDIFDVTGFKQFLRVR